MPDPDDRFLTCREILKWHYGHWRPELLGPPRRHYSLHYTYRYDNRLYVVSKVKKERGRVPFPRQFAIMRALARTEARSVVHPPVTTWWRRDWVPGFCNRWFVRSYTPHDVRPDWLSASLVMDAGKKLAIIHKNSHNIDRRVLSSPMHDLQVYDWGMADVLADPGPLLSDMRERGRDPAHIDAVQTGLTWLDAERKGLDLGPVGLTHHDLRVENILVRNGAVVEIVDWDRAHWDVQWYDVALAGLHLAHLAPTDLRWDLTDAFVAAYQAASGEELKPDALGWLFRFTAVRNLAVSRSPEKWARLVRGVEQRWGDVPSVLVGDLVAEDEVAADLDVAAEDGGPLGAVGVG